MRRLLFIGLAFGLAACSYIFELPTQATPAAEAGVDVFVPPADAAEEDDDFPDTAPPGPTVRFCERDASTALFCADFDETSPVNLGTLGTVTVQSGQLVVSSAVGHESPRSLLAVASGSNAVANVLHPLATNPDGVSLSFRQLISTWSTNEARLARITVSGCSITLGGNATVWSLEKVCPSSTDSRTATTVQIARGTWQRFVIGVRFSPSPAISLDIDDVRAVDVPAPGLARGPVSIGLGAMLVPDGSVTLFQDEFLVSSP